MSETNDPASDFGANAPAVPLGWRPWSPAFAFLGVMVVYLATMMPGPAFMDTGEFQTVTYVLGVAHPTGYPFYTMLGKLFGTLVPIGSWAYRMNLMSVLCASSAAAVLVVFSRRCGVSTLIGVAAALSFAFSLNTWRSGGRADPYSLTVLIGASLWLLALRWRESGDRRTVWLMALIAGLGLGSAGVLSMELPAIILFLVLAQPRRFFHPLTMIVAALIGVVALVGVYLYLPLRSAMHPPLNYGNTYTWEGFKFVALGGQVGGIINYATMDGVRMFIRRLPEAIGWFEEWLTPGGFIAASVLAAIGSVILAVRDWRLALCVVIGFVVPIYPTLTVPINDTTHYVLISVWLLFFAAAITIDATLRQVLALLKNVASAPQLALGVEAAVLALPILLAWHNWSAADNHDYREGEILARNVFQQIEPDAVVFCWWGPSNALWYAHYVEGMGTRVNIYDDSSTLDNGWGGVVPAIGLFYPKRPVYLLPIGDEIDTIKKKYQVRTIGDLHAFGQTMYQVTGVQTPAPTLSAAATPVTATPTKPKANQSTAASKKHHPIHPHDD